MFTLILFLFTVSAESVYSRIYLRGLKNVEIERMQTEFIYSGITYIEDAVFRAAKQGLVKYTTERFEGCDVYATAHEDSPMRMDKDVCENIVNGIYTLVSERFPDSEIIYDADTKQYTLKWD
jgi:hypothetical protein